MNNKAKAVITLVAATSLSSMAGMTSHAKARVYDTNLDDMKFGVVATATPANATPATDDTKKAETANTATAQVEAPKTTEVKVEVKKEEVGPDKAAQQKAEAEAAAKKAAEEAAAKKAADETAAKEAAAEKAEAEKAAAAEAERATEKQSVAASSARQAVANLAISLAGRTRYVYGGTNPATGVDCSGFSQYVLRKAAGVSVSRTSSEQSTQGRTVGINEAQPGDLVFYAKGGRINHVAVYIGGGKVVSASSPRSGVKIVAWNYRNPVKIKNVMG
jgi:cell wall-associated hydrolases (invasion-associated proteins)